MGSWEVKQIPQDNTKLKFRIFWFQNHNLSSTLSHFPKQAFWFRTKVTDKGQNSPNEPESHYNQGLGERGNVWREIKVDRIPGMVSHDILLYPFSTLRMTMTTTTNLVLFISLTSSPSILLFNHYLPMILHWSFFCPPNMSNYFLCFWFLLGTIFPLILTCLFALPSDSEQLLWVIFPSKTTA